MNSQPRFVLDASALIAYLKRERGYSNVRRAIAKGAVINAVNLAEVYKEMVEEGYDLDEIIPDIKALGFQIVPFGEDHAKISAELYPVGEPYGLSFGDRACLALGIKLNLPVLTAERVWEQLNLKIKVRLIR